MRGRKVPGSTASFAVDEPTKVGITVAVQPLELLLSPLGGGLLDHLAESKSRMCSGPRTVHRQRKWNIGSPSR
jgi:hypothetical protein